MSDSAESTGRDNPTPRFTLGAMFLFIAVFGCLCGGLVCVRDAVNSPEPSIVTDPKDLPYPWRYAEEAATRAKVDLTGVEFYRINQGFDENYMIRLEYTPERLRFFKSFRNFAPAKSRTWLVERFWEYMPEGWATQNSVTDADFYISDNWLNGGEGDQYVMMHDKTSRHIYLWYHFNF